MKLLIATTNRGKVREIEAILKSQIGLSDLEVLSLKDLEGFSPPEETGTTYEENALIKARHCYLGTGIASLADDSGIEVEALGGRPGVLSARYGGPGATDNERVVKLLDELKAVPTAKRAARFVCAAAFAGSTGEKILTEYVPGVVAREPRGNSGFGYDPVFYYEPLGKTFGELDQEQKSRVSHRGKAFSEMAIWLASPEAGGRP